MPNVKTRFTLDAMIKENAFKTKISQINPNLNPVRQKNVMKKLPPPKVSREMLERIMKRVERI
jgi:hypothetical protein